MSIGKRTLNEFMHFASCYFKIPKAGEIIDTAPFLEVKVLDYSKKIGLACNLIKMCAYRTREDTHYRADQLEDSPIDISAVLELALELISETELEVLDEIHQMLIEDRKSKMELTTKNER